MNEPPSIPLPPMGVRYPLYADEVSTLAAEPEETLPFAPLPFSDAFSDAFSDPFSDPFSEQAPVKPRRTAGIIAVAAALVVLAGIALLGWNLLGVHHAHARTKARSDATEASSGALVLSATAPVTAPPALDTQGHTVTYAPSNMLDGNPSTAWRMPGDGTGTTLTFTLAHPATITSVGLINGYAKSENGMDWYTGNRRVLEVTWTFDDGTQVKQELHGSRSLQRISVPDVHTGNVKLTLVKVSAPGTGPSRRDMTAISEVQILSR